MKKGLLWTQGYFDICNDELWFTPFCANALCCYDLHKKEISKIKYIDGCKNAERGFFRVICCDEQVIAIPAFESFVFCYDKISGVSKNIAIDVDGAVYEHFYQVINDGSELIMLPVDHNKIVKINISTHSITREIECSYKKITSAERFGHYVYLTDWSNSIRRYDLSCDEISVIYVGNKDARFRNIIKVNNKYNIALDFNGKGLLLDLENMNSSKYVFDVETNIYSVMACKKKIFLFPNDEDTCIYIVSSDDWSIEKITLGRGEYYCDWFGPTFSEPFIYNNKVLVMNTHHQCLYYIDLETYQIEREHIIWPDMGFDEVKMNLLRLQKGEIYKENGIYSTLENFIKLI